MVPSRRPAASRSRCSLHRARARSGDPQPLTYVVFLVNTRQHPRDSEVVAPQVFDRPLADGGDERKAYGLRPSDDPIEFICSERQPDGSFTQCTSDARMVLPNECSRDECGVALLIPFQELSALVGDDGRVELAPSNWRGPLGSEMLVLLQRSSDGESVEPASPDH